jgi:uncharacterized Zn finger protein
MVAGGSAAGSRRTTSSRQTFGLTWWGQRWIASLEALGAAYSNRLPRGRTYARKGTVGDLSVKPGTVEARVKVSRPRPYRVRLELPAFSDAQWQIVIEALAEQLRHAAALLDGRMPEDVDEVLADCGVSLFPRARELRTQCSCPDHANPCKHVAAVHYVLAQTFDADPFLLPALRGRDRTAFLASLRAARTGAPVPVDTPAEVTGGVPLSELSPVTMFDATGSLESIAAHPQEPGEVTAALRRLGPPPGIAAAAVPLLEEAVTAAAERAWQLATSTDDGNPLLAELRRLGSATTKELATELGRPTERIRAELSALLESGLAIRTGHARSTRYHA